MAVPTKLNERHRLVLRLLLTGMPLDEVSRLSGFCKSSIHGLKRSEVGKRALRELRGEIKSRFVETEGEIGERLRMKLSQEGDASVERLITLRDTAENERVSLSAAQDILDRLGVKSSEKMEVKTEVLGSPGLQEMLKVAAAEMRGGDDAGE